MTMENCGKCLMCFLCVGLTSISALLHAEEKVLTYQEVDAAEAEVRSVFREARKLHLQSADEENRLLMYQTQIDLLTGKRTSIPRTTVEERLVLRVLEGERVVVDNRKDGRPLLDRRFLDLKPGHKYRLRLFVQLDSLKGSWGVMCGCSVAVKDGNCFSPRTNLGCQPFSWREVSFDIEMPEDSETTFRIGFNSGTGCLSWGDLRVYELLEVAK